VLTIATISLSAVRKLLGRLIEMATFAIRILSGKQEGTTVLIPAVGEIVIGRLASSNIVVPEDGVSRRHAAVTQSGDVLTIQDLGSRNGTFVNGKRISEPQTLHEGDQIFVGRCIMKIVVPYTNAPTLAPTNPASLPRFNLGAGANLVSPPPPVGATTPKPATAPPLPMPKPSAHPTIETFRGLLEEIPLPDILQLLMSSRKSGVLILRTDQGEGRIYLQEGHVEFATIDGNESLEAHKIFYRMLRWTSGTFEMDKIEERAFPSRILESTEALLLEGLRQLDEIKNLGEMPPMKSRLTLPRPLPGKLSSLDAGDLDFIQLVHEHRTIEGVLNNFAGTDFQAYTYLLGLVGRKFVVVEPPAPSPATPPAAKPSASPPPVVTRSSSIGVRLKR
jgi:hypothetical protein